MQTCSECKKQVEAWNLQCKSCGYHLVLEPEAAVRARYLRTPSLGALLFTQGWTFGARLYVWFLVSLIPAVGLVALFATVFFGRRWAWKRGGWADFEEFRTRMRLLDGIAIAWIFFLALVYLWRRMA